LERALHPVRRRLRDRQLATGRHEGTQVLALLVDEDREDHVGRRLVVLAQVHDRMGPLARTRREPADDDAHPVLVAVYHPTRNAAKCRHLATIRRVDGCDGRRPYRHTGAADPRQPAFATCSSAAPSSSASSSSCAAATAARMRVTTSRSSRRPSIMVSACFSRNWSEPAFSTAWSTMTFWPWSTA